MGLRQRESSHHLQNNHRTVHWPQDGRRLEASDNGSTEKTLHSDPECGAIGHRLFGLHVDVAEICEPEGQRLNTNLILFGQIIQYAAVR
jgi:hypothetical protein